MEQGIWKDIIWYEWRYQISNLGNVKSLWNNRAKKEKVLKKRKNVYYQVILHNKLIVKTLYIHRLVAQAFIPNPENKPQINHIDWNKLNNRLENLEWCTISENHLHKYRVLWIKPNGWMKWKIWKLNRLSKQIKQYTKEWIFIKKWDSSQDITRQLKINNWNIISNCKWRLKTAGWYIWEY